MCKLHKIKLVVWLVLQKISVVIWVEKPYNYKCKEDKLKEGFRMSKVKVLSVKILDKCWKEVHPTGTIDKYTNKSGSVGVTYSEDGKVYFYNLDDLYEVGKKLGIDDMLDEYLDKNCVYAGYKAKHNLMVKEKYDSFEEFGF